MLQNLFMVKYNFELCNVDGCLNNKNDYCVLEIYLLINEFKILFVFLELLMDIVCLLCIYYNVCNVILSFEFVLKMIYLI